jgi:L-threonine kinase
MGPGGAKSAATMGGTRTGVGRCAGTFGELLQGALPLERREFLVTLPITEGSAARFTVVPGSEGVRVSPAHKEKSRRLAEELLRLYGLEPGGTLRVESALPEGKGCASSSADMVATARAIESAFGIRIPRHSLARIMSRIEPSDGVMYEGIVAFHQREGLVRSRLGTLPSLAIVALDEGGRAETTEVCGDRGFRSPGRLAEYERLLRALGRAVRRRHLPSVGYVSTRSAVLNQDVLPKEHLELALELSARYGALGVVATHSGTCLGLLFDPRAPRHPEVLPELVDELLAHHRLGVRIYRTPGPGHRDCHERNDGATRCGASPLRPGGDAGDCRSCEPERRP